VIGRARHRTRWSVGTRAAVIATWLLIPAVIVAAAFHLKLTRSDPIANASLAVSPREVKLWFSQRPELSVTTIKVRTGSGPTAVERVLAPLARAESGGAPITAPMGAPLAPGQYEVVWRTMARDGHVLNGVIPFSVNRAPTSR
jgi:copper resistance protein C